MDDDDSRSHDAPGPSRTNKKKRRSDDKDPVIDEEPLDIKVLDQKLIYHTYLSVQDLKEDEKYQEIEFNPDTLVRISGIVKAVFTEKWLPELNSFANAKNRGAEDGDIGLLFRHNPKFLRNVLKYAKDFEGEDEEETDGDEEEGEDGELEEEGEDFERLSIKNSRPQTPQTSKKKKSESPSHLITNYFDKSKNVQPTVSTSKNEPTVSTAVAETSTTPEPPAVSTFASSKRRASDSINEATPAKISNLGPATPQTSRTNVSSKIGPITAAPKPYVPPTVILPVPARSSVAKSNVTNPASKPKITMAPAIITTQKPPPPLPPKQNTGYDSFEDDDDFLEILEVKQTVTPKPPVMALKKQDSFYDDQEDEIIAQIKKANTANPLRNVSNFPEVSPLKKPKGGFTFEDDDDF